MNFDCCLRSLWRYGTASEARGSDLTFGLSCGWHVNLAAFLFGCCLSKDNKIRGNLIPQNWKSLSLRMLNNTEFLFKLSIIIISFKCNSIALVEKLRVIWKYLTVLVAISSLLCYLNLASQDWSVNYYWDSFLENVSIKSCYPKMFF